MEDDIFNLSLSTWAIGLQNIDYTNEYKGCEMEIRHLIYEFLKDRSLSLYIIDIDFKNHVLKKGHPVYIKMNLMVNLEKRVSQKDFSLLIDSLESYFNDLKYLKYNTQRPKKTL